MSFLCLLYFILLPLVNPRLQINLDSTDWVSDSEGDVIFQHDCLHVAAAIHTEIYSHQLISYCMSEWPTKWKIEENSLEQSFSFAELYERHITSEQLYLWSAPMDTIEHYQFYLDQLALSIPSPSIARQLFYNCTLPRFGSSCQYALDISESSHSSLEEIIEDFYQQKYQPTTLTCYIHLPCNRGTISTCLDWAEICDGYIDCLNGGIDEQHCWQLQINQCEDNEYRCRNGQCIPKIYFQDDQHSFECIDRTDEDFRRILFSNEVITEPTFTNEDVLCMKDTGRQVSFTTSCVEHRNDLIFENMFPDKSSTIPDDCWVAFRCRFSIPNALHPNCDTISLNRTYQEIINETCPDIFYLPNVPLFFGHIYLAYTKKAAVEAVRRTLAPQYVCYNDQLCGGFHTNATLLTLNNATCRRPQDFPLTFSVLGRDNWLDTYVKPLYEQLQRCNTIIHNMSTVCSHPIMYQCINSSKCISNDRVGDGLKDCDYGDDEQQVSINSVCLNSGSKLFFQCPSLNKCIHYTNIKDNYCDCGRDRYGLCADEDVDLLHTRTHLSFPTVCDGFTELLPINIDGRNETDETECALWQCNNTYTRCDGIWNCFDGADEVDCYSLPPLNCPPYHHICISPRTNQLMCLSLAKANDGIVDCLGAIDEPKLCRSNNYVYSRNNFYCRNHSSSSCIMSTDLCDEDETCDHGDDEQFCSSDRNISIFGSICNEGYDTIRSDVEKVLCERVSDKDKMQTGHFALERLPLNEHTDIIYPLPPFIKPVLHHHQRCHRGLPVRIWLNKEKNITTISCFCPPSFYGDFCQYQNQRVSLTLKFQAYSDSRRTIFALLVTLIDHSDERIIHSQQQFTYLYIRDCTVKFNVYLLYSTRPKNKANDYSIHIDIYEKMSLTYRGSIFIPIKFPFLPVHRVAVHLNIPRTSEEVQHCSDHSCVHGPCMAYSEDPEGTTFCRCHHGWSGKYCTIPHTCTCSSDSLCVGILANNRSLCVCPMNKFGSRCLIYNTVCQSDQNNTCYNGGKCVPSDEPMAFKKKFFCICPTGYIGERCELSDTKMILSFHKNIQLPQALVVHFIQVIDNASPQNGSTFKTIPIHGNSVSIYWRYPFHIAFTQLFDRDFYLITVQKTYNRSSTFTKVINPFDRCKYIDEVLNETIVRLHLIRRIKYYHLPCQQRSPSVPCFFDDSHFCLCIDVDHRRVANCFEFHYVKKLDCFGRSNCENGAQCLQDNLKCPQTSMCVCPRCFYGTRCQFSSNGFGLSLDAIIGYHITPYVKITQQPTVVKVSLVLTIIMTTAGFINGILSIITFKNKEPRDTGCGLYLLGSSIAALLTMIMFGLKFSTLLATQMSYSTNRSFLHFQCISMDFLVRIGLYTDQWLNTCVAIERVITTVKGIHFNKKTSKKLARYIIFALIVLIISTTMYDPFCRRLIDDDNNGEEKRIWCIARYPPRVQVYDSIVNLFHFFAPFIINLISAVIIIRMTARLQTLVHPEAGYQNILHTQFQRHSHLLYAPIILVILAVPRLILSFASGCMKSIDDPWVFLVGYFISFIPPMLTFAVFVIPSKPYKKEFRKAISKYRTTIQTRLRMDS